jgi:nardilysin
LPLCDDIQEDCNDGDYDNDDDDDDNDSDDGEDEDDSDDEDDGDESEKQDKKDSTLKVEEIRAQYVGLEEWLPIVLPPVEPGGSGPTCLECHLTTLDDNNVGGVSIDPWWQQEPYFDTQFTQGEVPESLYDEWEGYRCNVGREGGGRWISVRLSMPHANPYIPLDLSLLLSGSDDRAGPPKRIDVRPGVVLWHRPDALFRTPKVALTCRLVSARDHDDLYSCMMLELLSIYLNDSLNEEMYMAALAGLHSSMQAKDGCIHMIISGFSEKALLLLRGCLSRCWLEVSDDDSASLLRSIEDLQRQYDNCDKQASRAADNQLLSTLKHCGRYPASCKRSALVELACRCCDPMRLVAEVNSFRLRFLSQVHMEFSVFGNLAVDRCIHEIQGAADDGEAFLRCKGASPEGYVHSECFFPFCESKAAIMQIPTKTIAVASCIPTSELERNGCVEVYFQLGLWTVEDQTRVDLLEQLLEEPFFDELRTKQQVRAHNSCD